MLYLSSFTLPGLDREENFFVRQKRTCYHNFYPFQLFPAKGLERLDFEPVTVLYGGNGSGKTTLLNLIAQKLGVTRSAPFNRGPFFQTFADLCRVETAPALTPQVMARSRIITSDDVFDYLFDLRGLNDGVIEKREELLSEYTKTKYSDFRFRDMEDYHRLKQVMDARRLSGSRYVERRVRDDVPGRSNGESAFLYFTQEIRENGLYLLDEPENSLAAQTQMRLLEFLADSARFYGCQFVISTHSPFLLSMKGAKIYDLDSAPVRPRPWTELPSVRVYAAFFRAHAGEFGD